QSITVNGIDENALDDGGSGLLSNYTEDMKKILRAYTAAHEMASDTYYLFLVKNATSQSKLGYMPRKKQAGFIFVDAHNNADVVKTIAHELGHGAFHLKHTFSEYPSLSQGVTENLMDYPAKTRLDKWQWDHIHNPEGVLGLFEGDDEGALERVLGGEIVVEFIDVTSDFTPGVNKMIINYRIRNLKEAIGIHPDKKFRATLQVRDKNDNLVYEKELELEDIGRVEWDGFLATDKKDRILYETGPFKIQIKVFGGLESTWDSVVLCFTNLIDCLSGELKTSVSGYAEKVFNVNEDREKWEQFEFKNVDSKASFSDYTSQKNLIIQNLGLDEDINPLDYLNENLIWFEFLGESIVMHKRFAYALKLIKESLSPGDYAELSKVLTISNGFRAHKSTDDGVSRHQLGMAIDINPSSNPMLKSSSQAELFKYIRLATGLDMYNKPVTLNQTIEAQELFRSTVIDRGINSLKVKSSLQRISVYENDPKKFSLEELSQNVIESTLGQILEKFNKVLSESPTESALLENEIKLASPELKKLKLLIDDASEVLNDLSIVLLMDSKKTLE
ncbi:MAG: hypothetical protein KF860_17775, partial [Cyclobacteriaceae bacterium]|nr:hypothetical protein [Cyclobacteriaceae bacterium]